MRQRPGLRPRRSGALAAAALLLASLASASPLVNARRFRMMRGDSPAWARPDFDDGAWPSVALEEVPGGPGILWLRARIDLPAAAKRPVGVFFSALASHEIWWDGEILGRGGVVGSTPAAEVPGPVQALYAVPDRLASPGPHAIAIRSSAEHRHFRPTVGYWAVAIGSYPALERAARGAVTGALMSLSAIVLAALFAFLSWLLDRRERSFLLLAVLSAVSAGLLLAEAYRPLFGYSYDRHLIRLAFITALSWLLDVALVLYLVLRFPMRGSRWLLGVALAGATIPIFTVRFFDGKVLAGYFVVFPAALIWALRAARRRLLGSGFAAAGIAAALAALLVDPGNFLDRNLFLSIDVLLLCLLASRALQYRAERRKRETAELKSARLEVELLKKRFQPHFLMNTLTALAEWIEEDPAIAARMIQALSEELRLLGAISDRTLVRMEDEIALCRSHLEIMSCRKGRRMTLETAGLDPAAPIPPAVVHTLVENAITHGATRESDVVLWLRRGTEPGRVRYVFESPFEPGAADPAPAVEGTGLRYVRARLEESFGDRWSLASGAAGAVWRTEIVVPAEP
jgi:hypothetical protein